MYKYKNVSESTQVVIGFGEVLAGQEVVTSRPLHNPNFELVSTEEHNKVGGTQAPQPNAVIEAEPLPAQEDNR